MDNVLSVILGGGKGSRLFPLTKYRSKPAVPLGGKYRLVDIPVSNCINSGIKKIYVVTQFNSESLNRSVFQTYKFDIFSHGYIRILAAEQSPESKDWYQGTADAVRKNIKHIYDSDVEYVLILSGDQLYRMDYKQLVRKHIQSRADVTLALTATDPSKASHFGLARITGEMEIDAFVEKPHDEAVVNEFKVPQSVKESEGLDPAKDYILANMGIYVFSMSYLKELMETTDSSDFGKDIFPDLLGRKKMNAFIHKGYWEDIGTIRAFYDANLQLAAPLPEFNFYDMERVIYAQPLFLPPSKFESCHIQNSLISDGCIINRASIYGSLVGIRSIIGEGTTIDCSILMGADFYEKERSKETERMRIGIGKNCLIKNAIIDKNVRIGNDVQIVNKSGYADFTGSNYMIRDGIICIEKGAKIPDGTVI